MSILAAFGKVSSYFLIVAELLFLLIEYDYSFNFEKSDFTLDFFMMPY